MNLNNISLPYPVLGISDDILPLLGEDAVRFDLTADARNYTFKIELKFDNQDILRLINKGKAEYSCEYDCARTMLRCCITSKDPEFTIVLPRHSVNGRINFNCFVSVKEDIIEYSNRGFNADYEGATFNMSSGDLLVAFPHFHYDADIRYDKLQAAGSFMQIRESNLHEQVFFDISGNKIEIHLPPTHYQLYCNPIVKGSAEIIHSSLVINALTYALLNMEEHMETTWAKTIDYRLRNEDGFSIHDKDDPSNIPMLAQRLLKDPYLRLFNHIITSTPNQTEE
ncbi:MAG: hypothetical protein IKO82_04255 [Prevotella sp.]|nr:hypothetical protein [Prevotella sp.]